MKLGRQAAAVRLVAVAAGFAATFAFAYPGELDASFGTGGVVRARASYQAIGPSGGATAVLRQADGKILAVGSTAIYGSGESRFAIVRYLADGTVDKSFGFEGRVNGGPPIAKANGALLDAAGRILVVGEGQDTFAESPRFALARFLPDGKPDPTFPGGGQFTIGPAEGVASAAANAVRLDAAGRIIVVGREDSLAFGGFKIVRLDADGALDPGFGQSGVARVSFTPRVFAAGLPYRGDFANDVAIDANGRIVVVGSLAAPLSILQMQGVGIARFLADGTLDPAFGTNGKTMLGAPAISGDAVTLDASGRIVVAGAGAGGGLTDSDMAVFRFNSNGTPDLAFGTGGVALAGFPPPGRGKADAVRVDGSGRIIIAGETGVLVSLVPGSVPAIAFARFLDSGAPDTTFAAAPPFATPGRVSYSINPGLYNDGVRDILLAPGGTILWAGYAPQVFVLGNLLETGYPDPDFDTGGKFVASATKATVFSGTSDTSWNAARLQADGNVVTAGTAANVMDPRTGAFLGDLITVSRRLPDGTPDTGFAEGGTGTWRIGDGSTRGSAIAIDGSGRVLVAGDTISFGVRRFALLRLTPGGTRDATFGTNGEVSVAFGNGSAEARAIAIDATGRIVVGGVATESFVTSLALTRHLADGTLDMTFGTGGRVTVQMAGGFPAGIRAMVIDGSGRIVATGDNEGTGLEPRLARFLPSGALDTSFGAGGIVDLKALGLTEFARSMALDGSGRIVVAGVARPAAMPTCSAGCMALVRLTESGTADPTFGTGGLLALPFAGNGSRASGIAFDASGRIVLAGNWGGALRVVRLLPDGSADPGFGDSGATSASIPGNVSIGEKALILLPDGRPIVAGALLNTQEGFLARFSIVSPPGTRLLKVSSTGTGSGKIVSTPAGIDCTTTCFHDFPTGTVVSLAATGLPPNSPSQFDGWSGDCTGTGPCIVTLDAARTVTANFGYVIQSLGKFANISTRLQVLQGDNVLIAGFIVGGSTPKTVAIRARGPSLAPLGVVGALPNPRIDIYSGSTLIESNDDWKSYPTSSALLASGLAPADDREAAVYATLAPGPYTVIVSGSTTLPQGGAVSPTGVGIVEVFNPEPANGALIQISTRGFVQTGQDVMIAGFIIQGDAPQTVVVRASGPSLAQFGIPNALQDPVLQLFSGQAVIASNDDWQSGSNVAQLLSTGFAPADAKEAAILITLPPGAYTAIVSGKGGVTGVGIVEVFAQ